MAPARAHTTSSFSCARRTFRNSGRVLPDEQVSCCYLLTISTGEKLLELLTTPRKNGLWITTVEYGEDDMVFSPPESQITSSMSQLLEGMINNIHAVGPTHEISCQSPHALPA